MNNEDITSRLTSDAMKPDSLFISFGSEVNLRNFFEGSFSHRLLDPADVKTLMENVSNGGGKISACFEFGAVPSRKKDRQFSQLLEAFEKVVGLPLDPGMFFVKLEDDTSFPNLNFQTQGLKSGSLLAVEYYFEMDSEKFSKDSNINDAFSVSNSSMDFHHFKLEN